MSKKKALRGGVEIYLQQLVYDADRQSYMMYKDSPHDVLDTLNRHYI